LVRVSEVVDPVQAVASIVARAEAAAGAADGDAVAALEQAHRELQELLAEGEV
jgi:transcription elongation GreA/GreB family factor